MPQRGSPMNLEGRTIETEDLGGQRALKPDGSRSPAKATPSRATSPTCRESLGLTLTSGSRHLLQRTQALVPGLPTLPSRAISSHSLKIHPGAAHCDSNAWLGRAAPSATGGAHSHRALRLAHSCPPTGPPTQGLLFPSQPGSQAPQTPDLASGSPSW